MTKVSTSAGPNIAALAALVSDPARAQMVLALMDGRALTATELARAGGVTAQTASTHLARLADGGMLSMLRQGRHRYYRIADERMAHLLETMAALAGEPVPLRPHGVRDPAMRRARVCYDHLAGEMGVRLHARLLSSGALAGEDFNAHLTEAGERRLVAMGIDVPSLRRGRRPLCRSCLDWSERRPHLAGALGAALLDHFLGHGWAHRVDGARPLIFTADGLRRFEALLNG